MAMALAMGAYQVSGIEHPQNVVQKLMLCLRKFFWIWLVFS
jgi:hypothetical protein